MLKRFHLPVSGKDLALLRGKMRKDWGSLGKLLPIQHITPSKSDFKGSLNLILELNFKMFYKGL